jgi:hypothetical protein
MKKKWLIVLLFFVIITALYLIDLSKVNQKGAGSITTLDNLQIDEISKNWDIFYKVRAKIIDGQSVEFDIPDKLKALEGEIISLSGAAVFFGNGCEMLTDSTTKIKSFFILPSLGLAQSCVLQPDEAMRWTIMVNLAKPSVLSRNEMINAEVIVSGKFKIDTSKPYEAAFYIENATAILK